MGGQGGRIRGGRIGGAGQGGRIRGGGGGRTRGGLPAVLAHEGPDRPVVQLQGPLHRVRGGVPQRRAVLDVREDDGHLRPRPPAARHRAEHPPAPRAAVQQQHGRARGAAPGDAGHGHQPHEQHRLAAVRRGGQAHAVGAGPAAPGPGGDGPRAADRERRERDGGGQGDDGPLEDEGEGVVAGLPRRGARDGRHPGGRRVRQDVPFLVQRRHPGPLQAIRQPHSCCRVVCGLRLARSAFRASPFFVSVFVSLAWLCDWLCCRGLCRCCVCFMACPAVLCCRVLAAFLLCCCRRKIRPQNKQRAHHSLPQTDRRRQQPSTKQKRRAHRQTTDKKRLRTGT